MEPDAVAAPAEQQGGLVSAMRTSEPVVPPPSDETGGDLRRPPDGIVAAALDHRKRTTRQVRHAARARLRLLAGDEEALEDADLLCPQAVHDLGRKKSPPPRRPEKPGRRGGFKVWKTPFWKRRSHLWAERNAAARLLAVEDSYRSSRPAV
jgi:hypothetical protein